jgi:hypothetical protein
MRPAILVFILNLGITSAFGQNKQLSSTLSYSYEASPKEETIEREVTVTPQTITITKFLKEGMEDAVFAIEKTLVKKYIDEECLWYYCRETPKTGRTMEGRKVIIVIPTLSSSNTIDIFIFRDELNISHTMLLTNL